MNIQQYKQMLEQPWGKIQYEITFAQLEHIEGKKILDFVKAASKLLLEERRLKNEGHTSQNDLHYS